MTRARRSLRLGLLVVSCLGLVAVLASSGVALAGVDPVPWHTVISNRTDRLDPSSTFGGRTLKDLFLIVRYDASSSAGAGEATIPIPIKAVIPGETVEYYVIPGNHGITGQILSWSFKAQIPPDPFHSDSHEVFAFESRLAVPPDPWQPPALPPSYLTGEMPILGFASPGVVVGAVQLVNDGMFYTACPSVPADGLAWNNHGQYVRCIAHQAEALVSAGTLTQEEADAAVSAAAQSETGN